LEAGSGETVLVAPAEAQGSVTRTSRAHALASAMRDAPILLVLGFCAGVTLVSSPEMIGDLLLASLSRSRSSFGDRRGRKQA